MSLRIHSLKGDRSQRLQRDDLVQFFHDHAKGPERWMVGGEFEKIVVTRSTGQQLPYRGDGGIADLLCRIASRFGWERHYEGEDVVALMRATPCEGGGAGRSTITLEPGGQIELATPPCRSLHTLNRELTVHRDELRAVIAGEDMAVLATGLSPFSVVAELGMTSRERHKIMARYLPQKGHLALHMMKATASVQVALDYASEADARDKFFTALALSPVCTALFANSPLLEGKDSGLVSFRGRVWQHTDPDRSGLLEGVVGDGAFSFEGWVDYLLDVPMMFYAIDDRWQDAHGRTFRSWMEDGHDGVFPNIEDWEIHLTSVFPEVRLKQFVEVRGADAVRPDLALAFPGMWKGIFYDAAALDAALQLAREVGVGHREALFEAAITEGLRATHRGRTLGAWAHELLTIARDGLGRQVESLGVKDERAFLDRALEVAEGGASPGEAIRDLYHQGLSVPELVDAMEY